MFLVCVKQPYVVLHTSNQTFVISFGMSCCEVIASHWFRQPGQESMPCFKLGLGIENRIIGLGLADQA